MQYRRDGGALPRILRAVVALAVFLPVTKYSGGRWAHEQLCRVETRRGARAVCFRFRAPKCTVKTHPSSRDTCDSSRRLGRMAV